MDKQEQLGLLLEEMESPEDDMGGSMLGVEEPKKVEEAPVDSLTLLLNKAHKAVQRSIFRLRSHCES